MSKCKYNFQGREFESKSDLDSFLRKNKYRIKANDNNIPVKFSLELNPQDETVARLETNMGETTFKPIEHEYFIGDKNISGVSGFIDSSNTTPSFDKPAYKVEFMEDLESKGVIESRRDEIWAETEKHWDASRELGTIYHAIAEHFFNKKLDVDKLIESYIAGGTPETTYSDGQPLISSELETKAVQNFVQSLKSLKDRIMKEHGYNVKFMPEVRVHAKNAFGEEIGGTIDLIVVLRDGTTVIYDYKSSFKEVEHWPKIKVEKMKYQQGLYRNILTSIGIKVHALNIIPIKFSGYHDRRATSVTIMPTFDLVRQKGFNMYSKEYKTVMKLMPVKLDEQLSTAREIEKPSKDMLRLFGYKVTIEERAKEDAVRFIKANIEVTSDGRATFTLDEEEHSTINNGHIKIVEGYFLTKHGAKDNLLVKAEEYIVKLINEPELRHSADEAWPDHNNTESLVMARALKKYSDGDWQVVGTLRDAGVLLFVNRITDVVDVVSIRYGNLLRPHEIANKNLLGQYNYTEAKLLNKGIKLLEPTVGNMEIIKATLLILENKDLLNGLKLGSIIALSPDGSMFAEHDTVMETIKNIKQYGELDIDAEIKFDKLSTFDSLHRHLMNMLDAEGKSTEKIFKDGTVNAWLEAMHGADDVEGRLDALRKLQKDLLTRTQGVMGISEGVNTTNDLLNMVSVAILELKNEKLYYAADVGGLLSWKNNSVLAAPVAIKNKLFQVVRTNLEQAQDKIAHSFNEYETEAGKIYRELKESKGLSDLQVESLGVTQSLYTNLFVMKNGKNTMSLKNPNIRKGDDTYLSIAERNTINFFTKSIHKGNKKITLEESLKFPLMKATFRQKVADGSVKKALIYIKDNILDKEFFADDAHVIAARKDRIEAVDLFSYFTGEKRTNKIDEFHNGGGEGFELDLEVVMHAYQMNKFKVIEYNKILPVVTAARTIVALAGHNALPASPKLAELFDSYVGAAIFQETGDEGEGKTMNQAEKQTSKVLKVAKTVTSISGLGLSLPSGLKDLFANTWGAIAVINGNKAGRNRFGYKDWAYGIGLVMSNVPKAEDVDLITAFNKEYRMANRDLNSVEEKAKKGTRGLFIFKSKLLFGANAAPDYLHKMAIFIAHLHKMGAMDAHTVVDGELIYDVSKDKRFSLLFASNPDKSSLDYKKQLAVFKGLQVDLDKEGRLGKNNAELGKLPLKAFSFREVQDIKTYSNAVFGRYDDTTKTMLHRQAVGALFIQFKTFMLAKRDRYWMARTDEDSGLGKKMTLRGYYEVEGDESTWKADPDKGDVYRSEWVADMNEGILQTLFYMSKFLTQKDLTWKEMQLHDTQKSNLAILGTDLSLMALLIYGLPALFDMDEMKDKAFTASLLRLLQKSGSDIVITQSMSTVVDTRNPMASFSIVKNMYNNVAVALTGKDVAKNLTNLTAVTRHSYTGLEKLGVIED